MITSDKIASSVHGKELNICKTECTDSSINNSSVDLNGNPRLLRKIDYHVLPVLMVVYLFTYMDRVNIGSAEVYGLPQELALEGTQYNFALAIFFIPYILLEVPTNLMLKYVKPHIFFSSCLFLFGLVTVVQGLVKNYSGLLATRFFLGVFEAVIPGASIYIMSTWYRREELQKRFTIYFVLIALANSFGGILVAAMGLLNGQRGMMAWRWIFILEGIVTCIIALVAYKFIPNFPECATWLNEDERNWVINRLRHDVGESGHEEPTTIKYIFEICTSYKVLCGGFMNFFAFIPMYAFSFFLAVIISGWQVNAIFSQLLSAPVFLTGWAVCMCISVYADRYRRHFIYTISAAIPAIIAFIVLLNEHHGHPLGIKYFMLFLACIGTTTLSILCLGWNNCNLYGRREKCIGNAFQMGLGNLGGIVATFVFRAQDAPNYQLGYGVCLGAVVGQCIVATLLWTKYRKDNRERKDERVSYFF